MGMLNRVWRVGKEMGSILFAVATLAWLTLFALIPFAKNKHHMTLVEEIFLPPRADADISIGYFGTGCGTYAGCTAIPVGGMSSISGFGTGACAGCSSGGSTSSSGCSGVGGF